MTGLSDVALSRMREQFQHFLPEICLIQRMSPVPDGAGGWQENWVLVSGGTVACRLDPVYSRDQVERIASAEGFVHEYILTVPFDAPLQSAYRVLIGSDAYQVRNLMADHSWRVARRAYVTRVE